jgi:hypothetical protein
MGDNWDINKGKEISSKATSLLITPGKARVMG